MGSLVRWGIVELGGEPTGWPWAVLAVNLVGSVILGVLLGGQWPQRNVTWGTGLATGFCGALTTLSAFAVDVAHFLRDDRLGLAVSYLVVSLGLGLAGAMVGYRLGQQTRVDGVR